MGVNLDRFWRRYPALLYGLAVCLGAAAASGGGWELAMPAVAIGLPLLVRAPLRLGMACLLGGVMCCWCGVTHCVPHEEVVRGQGRFEVASVSQEVRHGKPLWKYRLHLTELRSASGLLARHVPCSMACATKRLHGGRSYEGDLQLTRANGRFVLALRGGMHEKERWSLVEARAHAKQRFKVWLAGHMAPGEARSFVEGVVSGEFNDRILAANLGRFGLQHIMVVSGFHFGVATALVAGVLGLLLGWRWVLMGIAVAATAYLLFVGPSPSVVRAYVAVLAVACAGFVERRALGLNSLGVGLIVVVLWDPMCVGSVGFVLSFLATASILVWYPVLRGKTRRQAEQLLAMGWLEQACAVGARWCRSAWALVGAVQLLTLPVVIYCFGAWPVMGLVYNAFFPAMVGVSMGLFVLVCGCGWLGGWVWTGFERVVNAMLALVTWAPPWADWVVQLALPYWVVVGSVTLLALVGAVLHMRCNEGAARKGLLRFA